MTESTEPHDKSLGRADIDSDAPTLSMPPRAPDSNAKDAAGDRQIGHYRIVRLLGRGGMGHVYLAIDTTLDRPVALKVVRAELTANPSNLERFGREARAVARLNHPHIVQIYEFGQHEGMPFYAMEYVEGKTLANVIEERGAMPVNEAVALMLDAADALDYALGQHVVHRDIKPGNMLITRDGQFKLVDFGLSRCLEGDIDLTQSGAVIGSPFYMSPEQSKGEKADHRSDIYSLGVTFYHMLTGQRPFEATSPLAVMLKHIQEPMPEPQILKDLLDGHVLPVLTRMFAKNPADRYQDYAELRRDLRALVETPGPRDRVAPQRGPADTSISRTLDARRSAPSILAAAKPSLRRVYLVLGGVLVLGVAGFSAVYMLRPKPTPDKSLPELRGEPQAGGRQVVIAEVTREEGVTQSIPSSEDRVAAPPRAMAAPTPSPLAQDRLTPVPTATAPPEGVEGRERPSNPPAGIDEALDKVRDHIRSLQFGDAVAELEKIEKEFPRGSPEAEHLLRRTRPWRDILVELDGLKGTVISAINAPENQPFNATRPPRRRVVVREATDEYLLIGSDSGRPGQRVPWSRIQPRMFCALALRALNRRPTPEQGRALTSFVRVFRLPAGEIRGSGIRTDTTKDPIPVQNLADFVNEERTDPKRAERPVPSANRGTPTPTSE
jgi:serine/threonine protein kinase